MAGRVAGLSGIPACVRAGLCRMEESKRLRAAIFTASLLGIFALMLLLNLHTPLQMDDYDYRISWSTGQPVSGFADVIASQAAHYRLWGGRSVVHTLAQTFLWLGKPVFNVANSAMYVLFLLELYALARPEGRRFVWPLLLAAHAALFCLVPFFGTVFLWLTGACNYLWGTVLALLPLLVLRSAREGGCFSRGGLWSALAAVVGLIAGWTNENTACGVFAMVFACLLMQHVQGKRAATWQWIMLVAQGLGILLMLLAPGNFARASNYETGLLVLELARRFIVAAAYGAIYLGAPVLAVLGLCALSRALGLRDRRGEAALWLLGAALAALALAASPVISDRSYTGPFAMALVGALVILGDVEAGTRAFDAAKMAALPLAALLAVYSGYGALSDVRLHEAAWQAQARRIEEAAQAGEDTALAQSVVSHSRFTMDISLSADPSQWPNTSLSAAYGVSIRGESL